MDQSAHPHQRSAAPATPRAPEDVKPAAVIDRDEFEADRRDGAWRRFLSAARAHVESLERSGRSR
jgi:hypothetical protein